MILLRWATITALTVAIVLLNLSISSEWQTAKAQNETSLQHTGSTESNNNTMGVINLKNHTITWIDKATNKTISAENFPAGNITYNELANTNNSLANTQNRTNGTHTIDSQNTTSNENLTTRLKALQGK